MSYDPLLTDEIVEEIAVASLKYDGDPLRISEETGIRVTRLFLTHPKIVARITRLAAEMRSNSTYTLEQHRDALAKIRDAALAKEDFKAALAAELAIGKVSGFYEPRLPGDEPGKTDVENLSNEDLKKLVFKKLGTGPESIVEGEIVNGD